MGKKAVFLDRDGTINSDEGFYYITKPEEFRFNPGVIEGVRLLNEAGFMIFIITNQGGVAKGLYTTEDVDNLHHYMCREMEKGGAHIDKIYYCPHHESVSKCSCRKPSPYMINLAIEEFDIDRDRAVMIGDSQRDIDAAEAAGIRGIKIIKNSDILPIIKDIINEIVK